MSTRDIAQKRDSDQRVIEFMIALHCKDRHPARGTAPLCPQCEELVLYARERNERCPYIQTRSFCKYCKTHCYKPQMRKLISEAMRYSGPRMLLNHPLVAIKHLVAGQNHLLC